MTGDGEKCWMSCQGSSNGDKCTIKDKLFDVDHAIPFSLWRNNDLWNLLPADPKINNRKRDMLPSILLIDRASDRIADYRRHMASDRSGGSTWTEGPSDIWRLARSETPWHRPSTS